MTKKSYITLCIVAILYIIMASTAILSPHGNHFASAETTDTEQDAIPEAEKIVPGMNDQFEGIDSEIVITNKTGTEITIKLLSMPALSGAPFEYTDQSGKKTDFTAVSMPRIISFSALSIGKSAVLTDSHGKTHTIPAESLTTNGNAYLIYADADKQPLTGKYGSFCVAVINGDGAGFYNDITKISLG